MCDPVTLALGALVSGVGMSYLQNRSDKKAKDATNAQINAANQAAKDQVENNKIANSVQTTEQQAPQETIKKLNTQKVPLNTGNTGVATASPTSVGLNLGGY